MRPDRKVDTFHIGPHTPSLKTEDVHLVHRLWLNITHEPGLEALHHHDILTEALTRFAREYAGHDRHEILRDLRKGSGATVTTRALGDSSEPATPATEPVIILPPAPEKPPPNKNEGGGPPPHQ